MNVKELERVVARIQSHIFSNSNAFAIGMLKSHFKGSGIQFKEHQVYNPGDDVRFIDWKLSAKTSHTFVKTFEEERNIEIVVVIDVTDSMFTGFRGVSKLQASIEIACLLSLLADTTKDKVSTVFFMDSASYLPFSSGHQGIAQIISFLERKKMLTPTGDIDILNQNELGMTSTKKMGILKSLIAKRKEVVFLSDFLGIEDHSALEKLLYRKNMHCFRIVGPLDTARKMPFSIFGKYNKKYVYAQNNSASNDLESMKGRWKTLSVKDRYLEEFVKEMM